MSESRNKSLLAEHEKERERQMESTRRFWDGVLISHYFKKKVLSENEMIEKYEILTRMIERALNAKSGQKRISKYWPYTISKIFIKDGIEIRNITPDKIDAVIDLYDASCRLLMKIKDRDFTQNGLTLNFTAYEKGFNRDDLVLLAALEEKVDEKGGKLRIREEGNKKDSYSLAQTIDAHQKINNFVDNVQQSKLSPIEKLAMCYAFVTQKVYSENESSYGKARDLISVMTGDDIVNVGYVNVLNTLCKKLGIESFIDDIYYKGSERGKDGSPYQFYAYRSILKVKIKDDKYGVDGYFDLDPHLDSALTQRIEGEKERLAVFGSFLLPPGDAIKCVEDATYVDLISSNLANANTHERFTIKGSKIVLNNALHNNLSTAIFDTSELNKIYSKFHITPKKIADKIDLDEYELNETTCKKCFDRVIKKLKEHCKDIMRYELPEDIIKKAYIYEILLSKKYFGKKVASGKTSPFEHIAEEFYSSLNNLVEQCKQMGVQKVLPITATAKIKKVCKDSSSKMEIYRLAEKCEIEQYLLGELEAIKAKQSQSISIDALKNIIKKVLLANPQMFFNPTEVLADSIWANNKVYDGGLSSLQSGVAQKLAKQLDKRLEKDKANGVGDYKPEKTYEEEQRMQEIREREEIVRAENEMS